MNIFKNAKRGDKFRTRNGRMALFTQPSLPYKGWYWLTVQGYDTFRYFEDGKILINEEQPFDIIGKWKDEDDRLTIAESKAIIKENTDLKTQLIDLRHINEEELDKLAEEYFLETYNKGIANDSLDIINEKEFAIADFKAGYRKAKKIMKTDIKRKIAYDAWSQGLIDKGQLDLMNKHCDEIDRLQLVTDKRADELYAMMIKNQATIK